MQKSIAFHLLPQATGEAWGEDEATGYSICSVIWDQRAQVHAYPHLPYMVVRVVLLLRDLVSFGGPLLFLICSTEHQSKSFLKSLCFPFVVNELLQGMHMFFQFPLTFPCSFLCPHLSIQSPLHVHKMNWVFSSQLMEVGEFQDLETV